MLVIAATTAGVISCCVQFLQCGPRIELIKMVAAPASMPALTFAVGAQDLYSLFRLPLPPDPPAAPWGNDCAIAAIVTSFCFLPLSCTSESQSEFHTLLITPANLMSIGPE